MLLKQDNATELNMTNGAEVTVGSWKSSTLPDGRPILDVIFIELEVPPMPVKLEGLPLNVVPICHVKQSLFVELPNKLKLRINIDQIPLLPDFKLMDYVCNMTERLSIKRTFTILPPGQTQMALTTEIKCQFNRISNQLCRSCGQLKVSETLKINNDNPPSFIAMQLADMRAEGGGVSQPKISAQVAIGDGQDKLTYKIRGLTCWNRTHFTCRMIGKSSEDYYKDGMTTGTTSIHEEN